MPVGMIDSAKNLDCHELHSTGHVSPNRALAIYYGEIQVDRHAVTPLALWGLVMMMLFSDMSLCRILAFSNKDQCALAASRSAVNNSIIDQNFLYVCPAGEMTRHLNLRFLYTSTCALF